MSGCSGNQAVAVSMRELSLGLVRPGELFWVVAKEAKIGIINGLVLGLLLGSVAFYWKGNPMARNSCWWCISGKHFSISYSWRNVASNTQTAKTGSCIGFQSPSYNGYGYVRILFCFKFCSAVLPKLGGL